MRFWLLTTTFYGNWLPGDSRGFVSRVHDKRPGDDPLASRIEHDKPGEVLDAGMTALEATARASMPHAPIGITLPQAEVLLAQFQETAQYRGWSLLSVAIMSNHVHWLVGLHESEHGSKALQSFKSYGSRVLNQRFGTPACGTWWTSKGSARALPHDQAVIDANEYVLNQEFPLLIWKAIITN